MKTIFAAVALFVFTLPCVAYGAAPAQKSVGSCPNCNPQPQHIMFYYVPPQPRYIIQPHPLQYQPFQPFRNAARLRILNSYGYGGYILVPVR